MKIIKIVFVMLLGISSLQALMLDDPVNWAEIDVPKEIAGLIPEGTTPILCRKADLNGDGSKDYALVVQWPEEAEAEVPNYLRELLMITKQGKKYNVAASSDTAILCSQCGGIQGDPFQDVSVDKKTFGIYHSGGSNFKWTNNTEFVYSKRDKKWQLMSFEMTNYDLEANSETETQTHNDFGLINFQNFNINQPMNGEAITAVYTEEESEAFANATATVEALWTPTPVPTYIFSRPDKMKNREMISIKAGQINLSESGNTMTANVSAFQIGKYEVTYELWYVVRMWAEKHGYVFRNPGCEKNYGNGDLPEAGVYNTARGMSWRDAIVWCNAYSEMMGLKPVYYSDKNMTKISKIASDGNFEGSINPQKGGFDDPYVKWDANGYRLPTETEWIYAASMKSAVISGMSGGMAEWCWDKYGAYPTGKVTDYKGAETGEQRMLMGGSSASDALRLNPFTRTYTYPLRCEIYNGFRVAKTR